MAAGQQARVEQHLQDYNLELKRDVNRLRAALHEILGILDQHYGPGPDTGDVTGGRAGYPPVGEAIWRAAAAALAKQPPTAGW